MDTIHNPNRVTYKKRTIVHPSVDDDDDDEKDIKNDDKNPLSLLFDEVDNDNDCHNTRVANQPPIVIASVMTITVTKAIYPRPTIPMEWKGFVVVVLVLVVVIVVSVMIFFFLYLLLSSS